MFLNIFGIWEHFPKFQKNCENSQEHWKWGHIRACVPLADFVNVTSVYLPMPALLACRKYLFKLSVLPASKAVSMQLLLDRVVQGAVEERHALSTFCNTPPGILSFTAFLRILT